jgi:release factor H-coupled RctB family protein
MNIGYYSMGNSVLDGCTPVANSGGTITKFYTNAAWIEGRAEQQLEHVAGWSGVRKIAAFPDLHPGKYGPVGCAVLADQIYPQLIGNDIGCGMSLFQLDLPIRKLKLEKALRRIRVLGEPTTEDYAGRLEKANLKPDMFATSLGTIGGGNHFCEVQTLAECAPDLGLDKTALYLLVHSGSRGFGNAVLAAVPDGAFSGMHPNNDATLEYVKNHDNAVRWASLNRQIIAERAADALRADLRMIVDAPHNLLTQYDNGWLHRKGAACAAGGLVPLAGSRATASYLLRPSGEPETLDSTAHGAGRRYDRSSMHGRVQAKRSDIEAMQRTPFGGRIICEDRDLLIEEAPHAYKSSQAVVADLEATGAATPVATFHPLLTFKKIRNGGRS